MSDEASWFGFLVMGLLTALVFLFRDNRVAVPVRKKPLGPRE